MKRLKYLALINPTIPHEHAPLPCDEVSFLPMERIGSDGSLDLSEVRQAQDICNGYTPILDGDVAVAKITPCFENGKGALCCGLRGSVGFGTTELIVLRARHNVDAGFLYWLTRGHEFRITGAAEMRGSAGQKRVTEEFVANYRVAVLEATQQRRITSYLDEQTAKIDRLIELRQRQMELLKEQRAAIIQEAVTRGLNPDSPMRESGLPWLGEIPVHWPVLPLKRVCQISYGLGLQLNRQETNGIPILSLPNVTKDGELSLEDVPKTPLNEAEKQGLLLRRGDLLFNWRNGSLDHLGKTALFDVEGEFTHVSFLLRLRFDPQAHDSRYFHLLINHYRSLGFFATAKVQVNNTFNMDELRRLLVAVPPIKEQIGILDWLSAERVRIANLLEHYSRQLTLLAEYRASLIHECVTGQRPVPDHSSTGEQS